MNDPLTIVSNLIIFQVGWSKYCFVSSVVLCVNLFCRPRKRKRQSTRSEQSDDADDKDDDKSSTSSESSDEEVGEKINLGK